MIVDTIKIRTLRGRLHLNHECEEEEHSRDLVSPCQHVRQANDRNHALPSQHDRTVQLN